jgi:ABC-type multidrug transport system ATPase subunit
MGFLGPNGAGKSTTMRILSSFMPPSSGRASIAGFDIFEQSLQARAHLGYMPENVPLYNDMRVTEYLDYRAALKGVPHRRIAERVGDVKELCGLKEVEKKIIGTLSKGYRQRVGLADALVHEPDLLILDEPTSGLDPNQIRQVRDLIRNLGKQHTILLSTHILPEVEMTCSRVIIINKGRIEACDTPENLLGQIRTASGVVASETAASRSVASGRRGAVKRSRLRARRPLFLRSGPPWSGAAASPAPGSVVSGGRTGVPMVRPEAVSAACSAASSASGASGGTPSGPLPGRAFVSAGSGVRPPAGAGAAASGCWVAGSGCWVAASGLVAPPADGVAAGGCDRAAGCWGRGVSPSSARPGPATAHPGLRRGRRTHAPHRRAHPVCVEDVPAQAQTAAPGVRPTGESEPTAGLCRLPSAGTARRSRVR